MEHCRNMCIDATLENQNDGQIFCIFYRSNKISFIFNFFSQKGTNNMLEIIHLAITIFWSFAIIFGVCEFGEKLSEAFEQINDVYDQFAWYLLPFDVQHMLSTLIMIAQKPIELRVFGSISCTRITFRKVSI